MVDIKNEQKLLVMAESKLRTLSIDFAVQILNLVKFLKGQHETIVSNQIGRAGTSIGANIHEAQYAHGKPDFIAKLQIIELASGTMAMFSCSSLMPIGNSFSRHKV